MSGSGRGTPRGQGRPPWPAGSGLGPPGSLGGTPAQGQVRTPGKSRAGTRAESQEPAPLRVPRRQEPLLTPGHPAPRGLGPPTARICAAPNALATLLGSPSSPSPTPSHGLRPQACPPARGRTPCSFRSPGRKGDAPGFQTWGLTFPLHPSPHTHTAPANRGRARLPAAGEEALSRHVAHVQGGHPAPPPRRRRPAFQGPLGPDLGSIRSCPASLLTLPPLPRPTDSPLSPSALRPSRSLFSVGLGSSRARAISHSGCPDVWCRLPPVETHDPRDLKTSCSLLAPVFYSLCPTPRRLRPAVPAPSTGVCVPARVPAPFPCTHQSRSRRRRG